MCAQLRCSLSAVAPSAPCAESPAARLALESSRLVSQPATRWQVVAMRSGLAARAALYRWQQAVAIDCFTHAMSVQLQAAQRQEEAELRERRWQMERRHRADAAHSQVLERDVARAHAAAAQLEPLKAQLAASQRECSATQARTPGRRFPQLASSRHPSP